MKVFVDGTTAELVINDGELERRFPVFSEVSRNYLAGDNISFSSISTNRTILKMTHYSSLEDEAGTPYASLALLKTALDPYFDGVV